MRAPKVDPQMKWLPLLTPAPGRTGKLPKFLASEVSQKEGLVRLFRRGHNANHMFVAPCILTPVQLTRCHTLRPAPIMEIPLNQDLEFWQPMFCEIRQIFRLRLRIPVAGVTKALTMMLKRRPRTRMPLAKIEISVSISSKQIEVCIPRKRNIGIVFDLTMRVRKQSRQHGPTRRTTQRTGRIGAIKGNTTRRKTVKMRSPHRRPIIPAMTIVGLVIVQEKNNVRTFCHKSILHLSETHVRI